MQKILLGLVFILLSQPLMAADEEPAPAQKTPAYVSLGDPMVLNLASGDKRLAYLQVKVDVLVKDEDQQDLVKLHAPALRHEVILALSEQKSTDMKSPLKREEVRKQMSDRIRAVYRDLSGSDDIEEILFSNFLVQ